MKKLHLANSAGRDATIAYEPLTSPLRKVLAWRTNKHEVDADYPPFVVQLTDYSPGRKEPLQRTVRPAGTLDAAIGTMDDLEKEKKVISDKTGQLARGWSEVEDRRMEPR